MALELRQQLKLSQSLVMTPQLQQAIKLLQLSRMELVDTVREELLENPLLEDAGELTPGSNEVQETPIRADGVTETPLPQNTNDKAGEIKGDGTAVDQIDWDNYLNNYQASGPSASSPRGGLDELPSIEATLTSAPSLYDHLTWQLKMAELSDTQKEIGRDLIGNIDPSGYLKDAPLASIAQNFQVTEEDVHVVLDTIQSFDPIGIAARSLAECLLNQAIHFGEDDDLIVKIIKDHMSDLERKNYGAISKALDEPLDEVYEAVKVIMNFDPRPGRQYSSEDPHYITPDVHIHRVGDRYFVVGNDDGMPRLKISNFYRNAVAKGDGNAKEYVQEKLRSAQWLIRSIQQRQRTIIRVTESILKFQRDFFEKGIAHLKPLILRDVAEDVGMHESTISRVTTAKYVHTPQGIFELKFFFNSGISRTNGDEMASEAVKSKIKNIISDENPKKPFSDQKLVELLGDSGITIARRTVAKYREQMGILSSSKRKRVF